MACLLLALILTATVLTVPTSGNHKLANAARTSPAEAFWRTALPGAAMPEAIRDLQHAGGKATILNDGLKLIKDDGDDPPPMNFNYGDYRAASRQNENAAPSAEVLKHAAASGATSPMVFFLEDAVRVPRAATTDAPPAGLDPPRLYSVPAVLEGGSSFVVCRREREAGGPDDDAAVTYVCRARAFAAGGRGNDETPVSP